MAVTATLAGNVRTRIAANYSGTLDLVTDAIDVGLTEPNFFDWTITTGTTANKADLMWWDTRTIASGADDDTIDLAGVLTDVFGNVLTFARVKGIVVSSATANDVDIQVGGGAAAALDTLFGATADYILVKPGGAFAVFAPDATAYVPTATTADILRLSAAGGGSTATVSIVLIGASA